MNTHFGSVSNRTEKFLGRKLSANELQVLLYICGIGGLTPPVRCFKDLLEDRKKDEIEKLEKKLDTLKGLEVE
jgi:hypothetical protein